MARVLVVGPHPDDQELGMGGTIALLADQGHDVLLLDLTSGEPTPFGDPVTRAREAQAALRALEPPDRPGSLRRVNLGLPNRRLEHTLPARHAVAGVIRAHQAQAVFLPFWEDAHPDHRAATRIIEDARFDAKLTGIDMPVPDGLSPGPPIYPRWMFYYECTHLRWAGAPGFVVDVTGTLERKMAAVACYHSQFRANPKNHGVEEWLRAQARWLGSRIGTGAGEPFHTKEPLGLTGLGGLVLGG